MIHSTREVRRQYCTFSHTPTFCASNRLSSLTHSQGATALASYSYGYDGMSRPTSINSSIEGLSTFSYDATSQLTVADHTSQTDETYGYNLNGSRNTTGRNQRGQVSLMEIGSLNWKG